MIDPYFIPVILGGTLAGAGTGLLGAYVVGMRIPFIGICVAHAALAGAVGASLLGWETMMMPASLAAAGLTALLLGGLDSERTRLDTNVIMGVLFSLTMGLSFMGIAATSGPKNELLGLLWGSVLYCRWSDVVVMAAVAAAEIAFVLAFYKELRAILFSRTHAASAGVRAGLVWALFLTMVSLVLTVNFKRVGGLMIYALLTNPAIAAFQLVRGYGPSILLAAALGALSGLGGFLISYLTDLPTGAVIVIFSSVLVAVAGLLGRGLRRRRAVR